MIVLRAKREARGWTRAELARRAGMHPATVGLIEGRRLVPYTSQLSKLALALGVCSEDAGHLLDETVDGSGPACAPHGTR